VSTLLRKLDFLQAWDLADRSSYPWLKPDEFPADPINDLHTSDNSLSVFLVDDDKGNIPQIAGTLAVARGKYDRFDYVLFPDAIVGQLGLQLVENPGKTADERVNLYHRNISEISAQRLVKLAGEIFKSNSGFGTVGERQLISSTIASLREGRIAKTRVKGFDRLRERAQKLELEFPEE
jgi:hypothetical protein